MLKRKQKNKTYKKGEPVIFKKMTNGDPMMIEAHGEVKEDYGSYIVVYHEGSELSVNKAMCL